MPKDATVFNTRSRPKGDVNYPPHERLDEASLRLVRRFEVFPLGRIKEYCRHIPYNSSKKDFYVKTSRESFEGKSNDIVFSFPLALCSRCMRVADSQCLRNH